MGRFPGHLLVVPALAALLVGFELLAPFDLRMYDQLMRLHQRPAPPEVVLVRIDADAEARHPEFVDRRPLALARLVDRLGQVKPRVIGVELRFDPRDPRDREGLGVLREALARHGNTVGMLATAGRAPTEADRHAVEKLGFQRVGLPGGVADDDKVVRGGRLATMVEGRRQPAFALVLLQQAGDLLPASRQAALAAAFAAPEATHVLQAFAFYGGGRATPTINAADVLDGRVHPDAWRDRIVIIGQPGRGGVVNLPTAVSGWAGDELLDDGFEAQFTAALARGELVYRLPAWGNALMVAALLLGFGALLRRFAPRRALWVGTGLLLGLVLAEWLAFRLRVWLPPVVLLVALPAQLAVDVARRLVRAIALLAAELAVLRREAFDTDGPEPGPGVDIELALAAVREAVASLRRQREYVHRLIDVQPAAIVVVDARQRVRLCNAQALAWRRDPGAPVGTLREWLAAVDLRLPAEVGQYLGTGSARLLAPCGEREVVVAFEPLPAGRDPNRHDTLVCVTELTGLVADQRERQAAIDFLSHDLRAPAHALIELCEGAQGDPALASTTRQILVKAEHLARRMVQMATTYLDFVRAASPEAYTRAEPVLLADVVVEASETLGPEATARQVRLALQLEEGEPAWVSGDAGLLRRAVENLLGNAIKVTPVGGTVGVLVQRRDDALAIVVQDEGPGIPPSRRSQIFQRFGPLARTPNASSRSVGLGLAMVMSVVARHRGTVVVDNRPEGGAAFRIELPLEREASVA